MKTYRIAVVNGDGVGHEIVPAGIKVMDNRIHELGKSRVAKIKMSDICNSAVLGIFALWVVWVSTSLLIHIFRG